MNNKINLNKKIIIPHIIAGYPNLEKTKKYILDISSSDANMIIIGLPFSDPVAENNTMQKAHNIALENNLKTIDILNMLKSLKNKISTPIILFSYLNIIYNFNYKNFINSCIESNISALMIPDLPFHKREELLKYTKETDIDIISFISTENINRAVDIYSKSYNFVYLMPSSDDSMEVFKNKTDDIFKIPRIVDYDESNINISKNFEGIILNSQIVNLIENNESISDYINKI